MEDWMLALAIFLVGVAATGVTTGVNKILERRWGIKSIRLTMANDKKDLEGQINALRSDTTKTLGEIKRDLRGLVRCVCEDPKMAERFDVYLRDEWMQDVNGQSHKH